ncbi:Interferon-related developmental regulator 1 [Taenia crassiceps]|uniref:Interferon-related developmental regulator 1 n=1 Tax=Taenia crassiceps TaxID=6207 RepID=A0ABR4Q1M1_9CEST
MFHISVILEGVSDDLSNASPSVEGSDSESSKADSSDDPSVLLLDKIAMAIDSLSASRPDQRVLIMRSLQNAFRVNYLGLPTLPEKWNYHETLISSLDSAMRRGKPAEEVAATQCLSVFSVQLTPLENRCLAEQFQSFMEARICDPTEKCAFRSSCATALGWLYFLSDSKDFPSVRRLMGLLEDIFKASCLKGDGKPPTLDATTVSLHRDCLYVWCLLYTVLPISDANELGQVTLKSLASLLQSNYLDVRLAAGDAVGLIYERIRDESKSDFKGPYFTTLIEVLDQLANNSDKSTSKVDSKKQRSSFRDLLNFLRLYESPSEQVVKLQSERLTIDTFSLAFLYESFCRLIAVGMNTHLRESELIRTIFDLGPPPLRIHPTQAARGQNKKARQYANHRASKVRTQHRQKSRDRRAVLAQEEC